MSSGNRPNANVLIANLPTRLTLVALKDEWVAVRAGRN